MTDQSPREIEREIEAERAELADTLDRLQDSISPEALVTRAETLLRRDGAAVLEMARARIADNPLATAVTAAGLAWLLFGGRETPDYTPRSRLTGARPDSASAYERNRRRAAQWLMSHDPDPAVSLQVARRKVSPRVAQMIDRLDEGIEDLPPLSRANVRQARLRAISGRMATERTAARA